MPSWNELSPDRSLHDLIVGRGNVVPSPSSDGMPNLLAKIEKLGTETEVTI